MAMGFSLMGIDVASVKPIISVIPVPNVQNQITIGPEDSVGLSQDRDEILYVLKGVGLITQGIRTYVIVPEIEIRRGGYDLINGVIREILELQQAVTINDCVFHFLRVFVNHFNKHGISNYIVGRFQQRDIIFTTTIDF